MSDLQTTPLPEVLKAASSELSDNPVMRSESIIDPRKAPTIEAMTRHIREYKRIDLKQLMPKKYWDKIATLGPPDVNGDPVEQAGNAAATYFWCNFVRTVVARGTVAEEAKLLDAEKAERVNIDRFSELAGKGKK